MVLNLLDLFLEEECVEEDLGLLRVMVCRLENRQLHFKISTESWLEALIRGGENDYRNHFRLPKSLVEFLTSRMFPPQPKHKGRDRISDSVRVHVFLKRMASKMTVTEIARMFRVSRGTVIKATEQVCIRLVEDFSSIIRLLTCLF
jgi:hypothetical protein